MEWTWVVTTTVPVLTFIVGLWWNRVDGDRRERRAAHATATAAFEQLQRATHLEVQDVLAAAFQAAGRFRRNEAETARDFGTALNRANVLASRIATSEVREMVSAALIADQALATASKDGFWEAQEQANRRRRPRRAGPPTLERVTPGCGPRARASGGRARSAAALDLQRYNNIWRDFHAATDTWLVVGRWRRTDRTLDLAVERAA
jgi:hypothetical protein